MKKRVTFFERRNILLPIWQHQASFPLATWPQSMAIWPRLVILQKFEVCPDTGHNIDVKSCQFGKEWGSRDLLYHFH